MASFGLFVILLERILPHAFTWTTVVINSVMTVGVVDGDGHVDLADRTLGPQSLQTCQVSCETYHV